MIDISALDRDDEGYLFDPEDWTPRIAEQLAREEAIELGAAHWVVLNFIRDYHESRGITPDIRHTASYLAERGGCDKKRAKQQIFELFPYGYVKQACKIAGMQHPRAWSTG